MLDKGSMVPTLHVIIIKMVGDNCSGSRNFQLNVIKMTVLYIKALLCALHWARDLYVCYLFESSQQPRLLIILILLMKKMHIREVK